MGNRSNIALRTNILQIASILTEICELQTTNHQPFEMNDKPIFFSHNWWQLRYYDKTNYDNYFVRYKLLIPENQIYAFVTKYINYFETMISFYQQRPSDILDYPLNTILRILFALLEQNTSNGNSILINSPYEILHIKFISRVMSIINQIFAILLVDVYDLTCQIPLYLNQYTIILLKFINEKFTCLTTYKKLGEKYNLFIRNCFETIVYFQKYYQKGYLTYNISQSIVIHKIFRGKFFRILTNYEGYIGVEILIKQLLKIKLEQSTLYLIIGYIYRFISWNRSKHLLTSRRFLITLVESFKEQELLKNKDCIEQRFIKALGWHFKTAFLCRKQKYITATIKLLIMLLNNFTKKQIKFSISDDLMFQRSFKRIEKYKNTHYIGQVMNQLKRLWKKYQISTIQLQNTVELSQQNSIINIVISPKKYNL